MFANIVQKAGIKMAKSLTDDELLEISDKVCLDVVRGYLSNKTVVPDFTSMPARYQLHVLKWFIDTAIEMKPEDVKYHVNLEDYA